jgi:hypothetical protein
VVWGECSSGEIYSSPLHSGSTASRGGDAQYLEEKCCGGWAEEPKRFTTEGVVNRGPGAAAAAVTGMLPTTGSAVGSVPTATAVDEVVWLKRALARGTPTEVAGHDRQL